jgi:hypothetical protein
MEEISKEGKGRETRVRALMVLIKDGEWKREEMVKGFKKVKV